MRILVGLATAIVLFPVAGMVFAFAIVPSLPIVLVLGAVLGPINWLDDLLGEEREEEEVEVEAVPESWEWQKRPAHAHA